ncbi:LssY C-terminal domain-containing protein [Arcanobacterium phocae]|uniref:LssY C-terminal domain-containing protein n=1 Tax=Arcanobacterium phocae TaxID=131112 RepID=UPI001C0EF54A|nr:LssY C-terminal domain-containing protein [Arcanobacterium phocae]
MNSPHRYPIPTTAPVYSSRDIQSATSTQRSVSQILGGVFFVFALLCAAWLIVLIAFRIRQGSWLINLIVFWAGLTYLVLPRLHQIFTYLYVPDYFIGRTRTNDGVLGDPINLAFNGDVDDLKSALSQAGWVEADPLKIRSGIRMIISTLRRQPYPSAPVSDLRLFGRKQTFAFQQEVGGNAAKRHHIRFWHVPEGWQLPGGQKVSWVAAATYDRAVGINVFTLQVTHKIDADIDAERDYVINTLRFTDPENTVDVVENFSAAYQSWNGGGDLVETDGHLPIVDVSGAAQRARYTPAPQLPHSHSIPPTPLWFSTVLVTLLFTNAALMAYDNNSISWSEIAIACALIPVLLCTFRRKRWAWLILMGYSATLSFSLLFVATTSPRIEGGRLAMIALVVLVLVTISDEKVHAWVTKPTH